MSDVTRARHGRPVHHWRRDLVELAALFTAVAVADVVPVRDGAGRGRTARVDATAEVLAVTRTATGLAKGHRLRLRYETVIPGGVASPGAAAVPLLREGEQRVAYLVKKDATRYRAVIGSLGLRR